MAKSDVPNTNEIHQYLHCASCMIDIAESGQTMEQRLEVGWTKWGLQIWCKRHNMNMLHIDFQSRQHPANIKGKGAKTLTEKHFKKLRELREKLLHEGWHFPGQN